MGKGPGGTSEHYSPIPSLEGYQLWPGVISIPAPHLLVTFPQNFTELRSLTSMTRPLTTSYHPPTRLMSHPWLGPAWHGGPSAGVRVRSQQVKSCSLERSKVTLWGVSTEDAVPIESLRSGPGQILVARSFMHAFIQQM